MKKLYRSRKYRVFGGVCGGLGAYFQIDPNILRAVWVVLAWFFHIMIPFYLLAMILLPLEPTDIEITPL